MKQSDRANMNAENPVGSQHSTSVSEVERFRKELGLRLAKTRSEVFSASQKEFASRMGVGVSTLQRYEMGEREPDGSFLLQLADLGGVRLDWLLRGTEPMREVGNAAAEPHAAQQTKSQLSEAGRAAGRVLSEQGFDYQPDLLEGVVRGVEEFIRKNDLDPPPDKKAIAISLMYRYALLKGAAPDAKDIADFFKLAA